MCIHYTAVCPGATIKLVLLAIWIPPRVEGLVLSLQTFAWEAKCNLTCTNEEHGEDSDGRSTSDESDNQWNYFTKPKKVNFQDSRLFARLCYCEEGLKLECL